MVFEDVFSGSRVSTTKNTAKIFYHLILAHDFLSIHLDSKGYRQNLLHPILPLSIAHYNSLSLNFDSEGYRQNLLHPILPLINSPL